MPAARPLRLGALGVLAALALAACDAGPGPSNGGPSTPISSDPSGRPEPTDVSAGQLGGPWRRSPTILDDSHIAIVSDACAAAAREKLGETEANLPTALVDARGEHFATVIMADDLNAIECLARFDEAATSATVDSVDRLSMTAVAPVDGTAFSVASVVHEADRPGGRTIAFGRIGPAAESAKVGFDDNSVILGTDAEGWWSLWWQGSVRASSYAAVDTHDIAVGNTKPFEGEREARVGPAAWWLDPAAAAPTAKSTTIRALVLEQACVGGKSPEGRVEPPTIEPSDTSVTVTFEIRRLPGAGDCIANTPFAVELKLPEPLGSRTLLDGGSTPPRDASKPPAGGGVARAGAPMRPRAADVSARGTAQDAVFAIRSPGGH